MYKHGGLRSQYRGQDICVVHYNDFTWGLQDLEQYGHMSAHLGPGCERIPQEHVEALVQEKSRPSRGMSRIGILFAQTDGIETYLYTREAQIMTEVMNIRKPEFSLIRLVRWIELHRRTATPILTLSKGLI